MNTRQQKNQIYGSPIVTLAPAITAGATYINDFADYRKDLPFDLWSITNNSTGDISVYIDTQYLRIKPNQNIGISNTPGRILKIIPVNVVNAGDVVISAQKEGMTADNKARIDFQESRNPINRILGLFGGRI